MRILFIIFILIFSSKSYSQGYSEEYILGIALPEIESASDWLVKNGIGRAALDGKEVAEEYIEGYDSGWGKAQFITFSNITRDVRVYFQFNLLHYSLIKLHDDNLDNSLYEYWLIVKGAPRSRDDIFPRHCNFMITKAKNFQSTRTTLYSSEKFIQSFAISQNESFNLPLDDLSVLMKMNAWTYSSCYDDSSLSNYFIETDDDDGNLVKKRLSLMDKLWGRWSDIRK